MKCNNAFYSHWILWTDKGRNEWMDGRIESDPQVRLHFYCSAIVIIISRALSLSQFRVAESALAQAPGGIQQVTRTWLFDNRDYIDYRV